MGAGICWRVGEVRRCVGGHRPRACCLEVALGARSDVCFLQGLSKGENGRRKGNSDFSISGLTEHLVLAGLGKTAVTPIRASAHWNENRPDTLRRGLNAFINWRLRCSGKIGQQFVIKQRRLRIAVMVRIQIRVPDELFVPAQKRCAAREISLAELRRRGIEYTLSVYSLESDRGREPPKPRRLGWRGLTDDELKVQAQMRSNEASLSWSHAFDRCQHVVARVHCRLSTAWSGARVVECQCRLWRRWRFQSSSWRSFAGCCEIPPS